MRVTLGLSVVLFATLTAAQSSQSITEYPIPYPGSHPQAITPGSTLDPSLWFTDAGTNSIGRVMVSGTSVVITEYPIPTPNCGPTGIATGRAAVWFTESSANKIGSITPDGTITEFALPTPNSSPTALAYSGSGVWFTEANANQIGNIGLDGTIREFPIPTPASTPLGIFNAPDLAIWFTEFSGNKIGRITMDGAITEYTLPTPKSGPLGIGAYSSQLLLFTETSANQVGSINITTSAITEYPLPVASSGVSGTDNECFTLSSANMIACGNGKSFAEYPIPTPSSNPQSIVSAIFLGPAQYWFVEAATGKIGGLNYLVAPTIATTLTLPPDSDGNPDFSQLPPGVVGSPYSFPFIASRGTPPHTWSTQPGALPAGLTLTAGSGPDGSATATISGTPTAAGKTSFFVSLTDSAGLTYALNVTIRIDASNCAYVFSSSGQSFPAVGGAANFTVTAPAACSWIVASPDWIQVTSNSPYNGGSGSVSYIVSGNPYPLPRSGTLTIGNQSFAVQQEAGPYSGGFGGGGPISSPDENQPPVIPHLAAEGGWRTIFTLVNTSSSSAAVSTSLYGNDGNLLTLPLMFLQNADQSPANAAWVERTLASNQSFIFEAAGPANQPFVEGSAYVTSATKGFAIFHYDPSGQEAVVPLGGSGYVIPFDNTNGVSTGIALESLVLPEAVVPGANLTSGVGVVLLDDSGTPLGTGVEFIPLPPLGHTSFVLATQFPVTANKRGIVVVGSCTREFHVPFYGCTPVTALGIRYTPPGTMTTIPPSNFGGSMPHIASGAGWQTTFVLTNEPTSFVTVGGSPPFIGPANAQLSFYDDSGNPLALPLTFPQTGATMNASSVNQTIPANGSLIIQTSGDVGTALLSGSAQLTGASGFAIFRYNPNGQEAVVPLQSAPTSTSSAYLLAFDNTNNIATGVAISNGSAQAVNVPVIIRDDQGNQLGTSSIQLPANGHTSFMLAVQYPATASIRGTLEFDIPGAGTSTPSPIAVLGIRSPPQLTFTTLPALPK